MKVVQFISDNKDAIIALGVAAWELFVRLKPTAKDWSIVNIAKRMIDIIPNKNCTGGTHA